MNFEENIISKYGVVISRWPLKKFCNPSDISTRNEVVLLKHAWENDTAKFSKLGDEEMEEWMNKRVEAAFNEIMALGLNLGNDDDRPVSPEPIDTQPHDPHPSALSSSNNQPMHSPNTSDENHPPIQPTNIREGISGPFTGSKWPLASDIVQPVSKRLKPVALGNSQFINSTVTLANGIPIVATQKPWKVQLDKGVT